MNNFDELISKRDQLVEDLESGDLTGEVACSAINDFLADVLDSLNDFTSKIGH